MTLSDLNALPLTARAEALATCCGARRWVAALGQQFPFATAEALYAAADATWRGLTEADWREAFTHHPQIGDVGALREKFASTAAWAAGEQGAVQQASEATLQGLKAGNDEYLQKFGYIFIVCATGKSAGEMLHLLQARLPNAPAAELLIALNEQAKIHAPAPGKIIDHMSQLTTHVLDTSLGRPAAGITIALYKGVADENMAIGVTNADGRIPDFLPAGQLLEPGVYRLQFYTAEYFERQGVAHFYPVVDIWFKVSDDSHYHVPLLLSPFGFSTYRGS